MSKALKVIGTIAGAVATVAAFIPGGQVVAAIAAGVSAAANLGAQALYKPPPARGSVTNVLIAADAPTPYVMGEGYFAGVMRHDVAYGATLKKVPNPYRLMVTVYSHGGPVQSISPRVELGTIGSWYSGFLYTDTQLGACPEASALTPNFAGAPGWGSTSKLSGQAAIAWNLKFDKDGKVFSSGVPRLGAYGQWVRAYDPRKDSTFPGGSGPHRIGIESTYEWTQNPALHAGTYAYGRYENGKRVLGIGMPARGVDWVGLAGWANVCDANNWTIFGPVYEPGNRWENLQEIAAAGGARAVFAGGLISWHYSAPRVALDTITDADIADDSYSVTAMASWRERLNTVVPKYISPAHDWQMIPDAVPVSVPAYVAEDGEVKQVEWPFNLVKSGVQANQLAAYKLMDSRELQPITLPCLPRLRKYRPGECLHIDLPELGLDTDAIILTRSFDPARMVVTLTLMSETPGKHDFALGRTSTPPPTPALKQTAEDRDNLRWSAMLDQGARTVEYDGSTVYSQGMTARWPDGSTWEYVNDTPSSGNPPPIWPATVNAHWTMLTPPLDRGKVFVQATAPTADESTGGDIWQDANGRYWIRRDDNHLSIGGNRIMIAGNLLTMTWTPVATQPVRDGIDAALATALAATEAAKQLALDAQATADGKVAFYKQAATPVAEGVRDQWFKTDTRKWYVAGVAGANSIGAGQWELTEDSGIGAALLAASEAQDTADGKIATFVSETPPTAESNGDFWYKQSTAELRRWNATGGTWGDPIVDLTAATVPRQEGPTSDSFTANYQGTLDTGQLPRSYAFKRFRGPTDVSATGTTWTIVSQTGITGVTVTVANGVVTIPAGATIGLTASIVVKSARTGETDIVSTLAINRDDALPPTSGGGGSGTSASTGSFISFSTTSFVDASAPLTVKTGSGGTLTLSAPLNFRTSNTSPAGFFNMELKWQYRAVGGSWADVTGGAAASSSPAEVSFEPPEYYSFKGYVTCNRTQSGLTASADYEVKLVARQTSGSTRDLFLNGTATAVGS